jgi:2-methylcitrate dehydratase PrpD
MSGQTSAPLVSRLAAHLARPVPTLLASRAGLHVMDWIGCALAGTKEEAGRIFVARHDIGPSADAFRWGGLGSLLEMDDVDKRGRLHPGPVIIPAAIAAARATRARGTTVFEAIVRGYEATIRLGRAVGDAHYALWHSTGTCGAIGAAAAAASILKLDEARTAHALALAMSQSAGLWQTRHEPQSMGKALHTAHAARAGVDAALLAQAGFRGPLTILEGPQGFFAAMCSNANPGNLLKDSGKNWLIEDVSFKPWPACRHAHAAIDAALALRAQGVRDARDIVVQTYRDALVFCDKPSPKTVIEAKFSLQHAVAVTLLRGEPALEDFSLESIAEPDVTALRARIKVEMAEPFVSAYPARFGARVLAGDAIADVPDALGDPENPVSLATLESKALSLLMVDGMSERVAREWISASRKADDAFFGLLVDELG